MIYSYLTDHTYFNFKGQDGDLPARPLSRGYLERARAKSIPYRFFCVKLFDRHVLEMRSENGKRRDRSAHRSEDGMVLTPGEACLNCPMY